MTRSKSTNKAKPGAARAAAGGAKKRASSSTGSSKPAKKDAKAAKASPASPASKGTGTGKGKGKDGGSAAIKGGGGPRFFLMKSEPDTFSIQQLAALPNQTSCWEGVRNYQVSLVRGVIAFESFPACLGCRPGRRLT